MKQTDNSKTKVRMKTKTGTKALSNEIEVPVAVYTEDRGADKSRIEEGDPEAEAMEFLETSRYRCMFYRDHLSEELYMRSCGIEQCIPGEQIHFEDRPGYHIHLVLSGQGTYSLGGEVQTVRHNQFFICRPGEDPLYQADSNRPWRYLWLTIDGSRAGEICDSCGFTPQTHVLDCHVDTRSLIRLVRRMLDHPQLSLASQLLRQGLMMEFISLVLRSFQGSDQTRPVHQKDYAPEDYVRYALDYIHGNYERIRINEIAQYIGIHRSYLSAIFKKQVGMSPQEYLLRYRMEQAEKLLTGTGLPVQEIAGRIGYEDPLTFSKMFKQVYGLSPLHYREQKAREGIAQDEGGRN